MRTRRQWLAASGAAVASVCSLPAVEGSIEHRDLYELRKYLIVDEAQNRGLGKYLKDAAIPALNRIGIAPVGVFFPEKENSPVYVLLRHPSLDSLLTSTPALLADAEYRNKGADFLNAPADKPAFQRVESSLLLAFKGMNTLETLVRSPGRIFQLRIYESPSVKAGQKKIEMFNDAGEIDIFRRVGLRPVFFGETLVGAELPNLTYMLVFESGDQLKTNWSKFGSDPDWKRLSKMPEYADKTILSGITNLILKPAEYSQI